MGDFVNQKKGSKKAAHSKNLALFDEAAEYSDLKVAEKRCDEIMDYSLSATEPYEYETVKSFLAMAQ